jgi:mRNA interferase MazF
VVISRGDIHWASIGDPIGSSPGYRRPVVVVSADVFNASSINTVVVATISSNTDLDRAPGNVLLAKSRSGLRKDSVVNVSQIVTLEKRQLDERVAALDSETMTQIEFGLRLVLQLDVA